MGDAGRAEARRKSRVHRRLEFRRSAAAPSAGDRNADEPAAAVFAAAARYRRAHAAVLQGEQHRRDRLFADAVRTAHWKNVARAAGVAARHGLAARRAIFPGTDVDTRIGAGGEIEKKLQGSRMVRLKPDAT